MTEDKRSIIQMVAGLIEQGKKNQDKIAYSKILDTFSGVEISSEQFVTTHLRQYAPKRN